MSWHAIMSGQRALRAVQSDEAPASSVPLPNYSGIPHGGSAGRELRVVNGALAWVNVDAAAAWENARVQRDRLIRDTDWRVVKAMDRTEAWAISPWKNYRQALRDITTQSDPFNITWPTPPSE